MDHVEILASMMIIPQHNCLYQGVHSAVSRGYQKEMLGLLVLKNVCFV